MPSNQRAMRPDQPFRPLFHFTPPQMWMNDPNGLVFFRGEYHLFYQYHPESTSWGPMHWGHAVSQDLVHWKHLPIALYPDEIGTIFSGSAVIDWENTAGFGRAAMVAAFTHFDPQTETQSQSLAYSVDRGKTWTKYAGNPVLSPPPLLKDFRDPKVFWYGTPQDGQWVMVIVAGNAVLFFTSPDLVHWDPSGSFGFGYGATSGVWETPDLFELTVAGGSESRWVLTVGVGDGGPNGGSATQYFVGTFDGHTFHCDNPKETVLWLDYGADLYATQTWNEEPRGRRVLIGWMSNWQYAREIPTSDWRGSFTFPRELTLVETSKGFRVAQKPIDELHSLETQTRRWKDETLDPGVNLLAGIKGAAFWIQAVLVVDHEVEDVGLRVFANQEFETTIGYTPKGETLYVDRRSSGTGDFDPGFPTLHRAPLQLRGGRLTLEILVDRSSIEIFANDGLLAMTERVFPCETCQGLELFGVGGAVTIESLVVHSLKPARFSTAP